MRLIVISGRSGSGKSSALNALEDRGFYCIDNLPIGLLDDLVTRAQKEDHLTQVAVSIDARNLAHEVLDVVEVLHSLPQNTTRLDVVYLDAQPDILLQRFSSTRRRHPLSTQQITLADAIERECDLLAPLADMADLMLDTSKLSVHELRSMILRRVADTADNEMSILLESFGFKHGNPVDADFVFDVRQLPNPYWEVSLRAFNGLDQPVQQFLTNKTDVTDMLSDIEGFLTRWIPGCNSSGRSYLTIAIGCTGGQHRSVFCVEQLAERLGQHYNNIQIRHRELDVSN